MMRFPHVRRVSVTHFSNTTTQVEDTSLVSFTMKDGSFLGIEVAWSMCLQDDVFKSVLQEERYYFPDGNMNFCTS